MRRAERLRPADLHAAQDNEQLSALDAAFLFLERPNQAFQIGCIAILEKTVPFEDLIDVLAERTSELRRFQQVPVRARMDLGWPVWRDAPRFDPRQHVRHVAVPPPGDEEKLAHVIETLLSTPLPPDRPRWEIHLIDGLAGDRAALLFKVHHSMNDGVSGFKVLEQLADPEPGEPRLVSGPTSDEIADEPAVATKRTRKRGIAGLIDVLRDPGDLMRAGARDLAEAINTIATFLEEPSSPLPFNGHLGHGRRTVWRSYPFDEFVSLRTAADCTINDAVLAVVSGAIRHYLEGTDVDPETACVRALVPASVRKPGDELELGNQVEAMFPRLPVDVEDPIERLHLVREEMRQLKGRRQTRATGLVLALAGTLPSITEAAVLRAMGDWQLVNTLCTNIPGPTKQLRLLGRKILDIHPIAPLFLDVGLAFAVASYAGKISICAIADPSLVPDAERIGAALDTALYETRDALWDRSEALAIASRLARGPTVAELMSRNVDTIGANDSLERAHDIMRKRRVRHLPIVDHGLRVIGVLSQRDLLDAAPNAPVTASEADRADRASTLGRLLAAGVLDTRLMVALPHEPAIEAGRRMVEHEIDSLPVVDDGGRLLGMVTEEHILRWTTDKKPRAQISRAS